MKEKYFRWWDKYLFKVVLQDDGRYRVFIRRLWSGWLNLYSYGDKLATKHSKPPFEVYYKDPSAAEKDLARFLSLKILDHNSTDKIQKVKKVKGSIDKIWFEANL